MIASLKAVQATSAEVEAARSGDDVVPDPDVVMDRGFTVRATPEAIWPWLQQLGKWRAGWYFPGSVERFIPRSRRGARRILPQWQQLQVGDVVPDYGGRNETFEVVSIASPSTLVYRSRRGRTDLSWSITLNPLPGGGPDGRPATRIHLRLRLGPVRRKWLAESAGEVVDLLTIAGMAAGLQERLALDQPNSYPSNSYQPNLAEHPLGEQPATADQDRQQGDGDGQQQ